MQSQHFLQTKAWGNVREAQGHRAVWINDVLMLVKQTPKPFKDFGVITQADLNILDWDNLLSKARELKLSHVHIDPGSTVDGNEWPTLKGVGQLKTTAPLILRSTVLINLKKSEDELLADMKYNTRYNCRYALRKGIKVEVRDDDQALEIFLKLFFQTVKRQNFLGRKPEYYRQVWRELQKTDSAKIAIASYENEPLVARFLFLGEDTIFTAYTGSTRKHSKLKPTYAALWEVMRWGKKHGYGYINLWGVKPAAQEGDPEYGYSKFKMGFGGTVVNYLPSKDLVIDSFAYYLFRIANKFREFTLKLLKNITSRY